jgi:flagellar operon protein (TIGR03826 family)
MGPNLRNCSICGRVFAYKGRDICSKCLEKEDGDYAIVRRYVRDHPGASVPEIAEATKIDEEKILQFIRDGRLVRRSSNYTTLCQRCGKAIPGGKYCENCLRELGAEIKSIIPSARKVEPEIKTRDTGKDKMHIKQDN